MSIDRNGCTFQLDLCPKPIHLHNRGQNKGRRVYSDATENLTNSNVQKVIQVSQLSIICIMHYMHCNTTTKAIEFLLGVNCNLHSSKKDHSPHKGSMIKNTFSFLVLFLGFIWTEHLWTDKDQDETKIKTLLLCMNLDRIEKPWQFCLL